MRAQSRFLAAVGVLSLMIALASAGFLERSVQFLAPELPFCFTTNYNRVHLVELIGYDATSSTGVPFYGVRDEIGRIGKIGQLKYQCPLGVLGQYNGGILHAGVFPCDCPNDGVTVCYPVLRLSTSSGTRDIQLVEADWSVPIRTILTPLVAPGVLVNSPTNAAFPNANQGCLPLTNAAAVAGNFAVVYRGSCQYQTKVNNAVAAGAIGVVIIDSVGSELGTANIESASVPVFSISNADGVAVLNAGAGATLSVGKSIGTPGTGGISQQPAGLLQVPFARLDDDVDYTTYVDTIQYIKGSAALDPRGYLFVNGVNGQTTSSVYDISQGLANPTKVASLLFADFRDLLATAVFINPIDNPSRFFLVGANFFSGNLLVYDVTDVTNIFLVDSLPLANSQNVARSDDGRWVFAESSVSFATVPAVNVYSFGSDGVLNLVATITRTDLSPLGSTITGIAPSGNSLYIGWGAFGITAHDISNPANPIFTAAFNTYGNTNATLPYTVGVQSVCSVPGLQDIVYIANVDNVARITFQGFHLTRGAEQFLATSAADQLVTIRTLLSGGETQIAVNDKTFIQGRSPHTAVVASSSAAVVDPNGSFDLVLTSHGGIEAVVPSRETEVAAPPPRRPHIVFQNQTLPSNVVIIQIPVPVLVNSAATLSAAVVVSLIAAVVMAL